MKDYDDCYFYDLIVLLLFDYVDFVDFIDVFYKEIFDDVSDFFFFNCCKII